MSTIGVDTGGTFTDLVFLRDDKTIEVGKRPSTPRDFAEGVVDVVDSLNDRESLAEIACLYHGATVTTNAMITRTGATVGFITTRGHRDSLPMMRVSGRTAGLQESELKAYSYTSKPLPLIPKTRILEVTERLDSRGNVIVPLNEEEARTAVRELVGSGVESIGVCLLWSFMNSAHEARIREIIEEEAPQCHVSISSDIVPAVKEYERSATTAVNAYVAPLLSSYLGGLEERLADEGLASPLFVMQSLGGAMRTDDGERRAVNTLFSGPAGGVVASRYLGSLAGHKNIICADVGGTSFDVALVVDGEPVISSTSTIDQYTLLVPTIDIVSIGAGGGSIAWVDLGRLRVGPLSAGADPGPVCYGRGGEEPTVTDADVVLGYIDPSYFLGGEIALDRDLAARAIEEKIARPLGMSLEEAAAGIIEIANQHMSDLLRKVTIERGYDPRDFVVYAYGGAGPLHGGAFGSELGAQGIVFPLGNTASAFSALGLAVADLTTATQVSDLAVAPFDPHVVNSHFNNLTEEATDQLSRAGIDRGDVDTQRFVELRYKGQVHEVPTPVPNEELTAAGLERVIKEFERRYEALYGPGSGFREGGIELINYRVLATAAVSTPEIGRFELQDHDPSSAQIGEELLYWRETGRRETTAIYGDGLRPGMEVEGPAVIRLSLTTCLVHPGQRAVLGPFGNIELAQSEKPRLEQMRRID